MVMMMMNKTTIGMTLVIIALVSILGAVLLRSYKSGVEINDTQTKQDERRNAESQSERETISDLKRMFDRIEEDNTLLKEELSATRELMKEQSANSNRIINDLNNKLNEKPGINKKELADYVNSAISKINFGQNINPAFEGQNYVTPSSSIEDYSFSTPPDLLAQGVNFDSDRINIKPEIEVKAVLPAYTLLPGTKIFGASLLDSIIAEIPINSEFNAEFEFSVRTSSKVLTANGHEIPGVQGTIWTGVATGNYTLGCADARLTKLTIVYENGRYDVVTGSRQDPLAKLSTTHGVTCLPGQFYSNAKSLLAALGVVNGVEVAGQLARAEGTRLNSSLTESSLTITDRYKALGGAFATGVTRDVRNYLVEFLESASAIIYVPMSEQKKVDIRIMKEIFIDYDNTKDARRVDNYVSTEFLNEGLQ